MSNGPCKDCELRQLGCHSSCERYLAFKELSKAQKAQAQRFAELRTYKRDRISQRLHSDKFKR